MVTSSETSTVPITDWNAIRVRLKSRYSNRFRLSTEDGVVDLRQWRHFAARAPGKLRIVPFPGSATLNAYANRVAAKISGIQSPIVLGVHRKGLSILREIVDRLPELRTVPVVSDRMPEEDLQQVIRSKRVLIIDDSIHGGEKSAALSRKLLRDFGAQGVDYLPVAATDEGSEEVRKWGANVEAFLSVPKAEFQEIWDKVLIPAILNLRYGPLSNLMESTVRVHSSFNSLDDSIVDVLSALIETTGVDFIAETVETSAAAPVFHGVVEFTDERTRAVFDSLRRNDPGYQRPSEAKLRLFFLGSAPIELHFAAVIHWHTKSPEESYRKLERDASERMLIELLSEFRAKLQIAGLESELLRPSYPGEGATRGG